MVQLRNAWGGGRGGVMTPRNVWGGVMATYLSCVLLTVPKDPGRPWVKSGTLWKYNQPCLGGGARENQLNVQPTLMLIRGWGWGPSFVGFLFSWHVKPTSCKSPD